MTTHCTITRISIFCGFGNVDDRHRVDRYVVKCCILARFSSYMIFCTAFSCSSKLIWHLRSNSQHKPDIQYQSGTPARLCKIPMLKKTQRRSFSLASLSWIRPRQLSPEIIFFWKLHPLPMLQASLPSNQWLLPQPAVTFRSQDIGPRSDTVLARFSTLQNGFQCQANEVN